MDNLLMDMFTILGFQLIPGFGFVFLLVSGLSRTARLKKEQELSRTGIIYKILAKTTLKTCME